MPENKCKECWSEFAADLINQIVFIGINSQKIIKLSGNNLVKLKALEIFEKSRDIENFLIHKWNGIKNDQ